MGRAYLLQPPAVSQDLVLDLVEPRVVALPNAVRYVEIPHNEALFAVVVRLIEVCLKRAHSLRRVRAPHHYARVHAEVLAASLGYEVLEDESAVLGRERVQRTLRPGAGEALDGIRHARPGRVHDVERDELFVVHVCAVGLCRAGYFVERADRLAGLDVARHALAVEHHVPARPDGVEDGRPHVAVELELAAGR